MPLLGATGNASEYSFRGTYDEYPLDIDFGSLLNAEPGKTYLTTRIIEDINYKVPISITGDGEYLLGNVIINKTFDSTKIKFDETVSKYDSSRLILYQPAPVSNPDTFDTDNITFDQTTTFDQVTITPTTQNVDLGFTKKPSYLRNKNSVTLRIFGVPPEIVDDNLFVLTRTTNLYTIPLGGTLSLDLREGSYSFPSNAKIQIDNRTFQGTGIGTEYYGKTYSTTVTIGKKEYTWIIKTKQAGSATRLFFNDANDIQFSSQVVSNPYTVSGLTDEFNYTAEITSGEGTLSVNYNDFVRSATIKNGDILRLNATSSSLNATKKTVDLKISVDGTVGSATTSWNVTTLDAIPSNLNFTNNLSAEINAEVLSDIVKIDGLSNNIEFDVSITTTDGLLSVNRSGYVKSAKIKNGDELQLKVNTSGIWLEEKNITLRLANTSVFWTVKNRSIQANSDLNASNLIFAAPLESINGYRDMSPEIRLKTPGLSSGLRSNVSLTPFYQNNPTISTEQSKYYLSSYKLAKGTSRTQFEANNIRIDTDPTQVLGTNNFTMELWVRFSSFNFSGENSVQLLYATYQDSRNANDYFFQVTIKGDNWPNVSQYKRGLWFGYPDPTTGTMTFWFETAFQVFTTNTWHHIAITRNQSTFNVFVDGNYVAGGSRAMNLTSTRYNFMLPGFSRLIGDDMYVQDFRLYRGLIKYTSSFNPNTVTSILEPYTSVPNF